MYLVASKDDRNSEELAKNVVSYLRKTGQKYSAGKETGHIGSKNDGGKFSLVIAVGDDRFILKTFRELGKSQIPVFAIASAQSFLAQSNALTYKYCLDLIKKNKYVIFRRSRLVAKFDKKTTQIGLNDIGLFSSKSASLLKYSLVLNSEPFWRDAGDGIVVATPTGSTGYSLSAGGPIILEEPNILALTPISSLEKHSPLIVSGDAKIKLADIEGYSPILIVDGEIRIPVSAKEVVIEKSPYSANFVMFSKEHQLESRLKKRTVNMNISRLKGLPASSKLLYKVLLHEGNMTQKELIEASLLPERTVRYALNELLKKSIVSCQPHFRDARQTVYGV